jgi:putative DNA primase/helicase
MTIHNHLHTNVLNFDLGQHIQEYGPPHYPTKRDPAGHLNEVFWSAFFATFNEIIYENKEDQFYKYGGRIYDATSVHLLREQISSDIMKASQDWPGYGPMAQLCNARHLSGVVTHLKGKVQMEGAFNHRREYIHVDNGVIDLSCSQPKLVSFDPKFVSRNLIPIEFVAGAGCPRFKGELLRPLSADDVEVLQKLFGMFLGGINFLQKILILQGASGAGKSQLAGVARLLLGEVNCEELRTAHLGDRFELARYMAKILLIGADVAGDFLNQPGAHHLKKMTGGDTIGLERKYSNQSCTIEGVFCVLITCNNRLTVRLDGDRGAWSRRLILINYDQKTHTTDVTGFARKLVAEEGPGILNWALEGLEKVNDDVDSMGTILLSKEQKARVGALLDESEGLRLFVTNHITPDPQSDLTTDEIVQKYAGYASDPTRSWTINTKYIQRHLPDIMMQMFKTPTVNRILRNGKNLRGYRFVKFNP